MVTRKRNVAGGQGQKNNEETLTKQDKVTSNSALKNGVGVSNENHAGYSKRARKIMDRSYLWNLIGFFAFFGFSYFVLDYFRDLYDDSMAPHDEEFTRLFIEVPCSNDYGKKFKGCAPKRCGRCVMDNLFEEEQISKLRELAERGMAHGGSNGGASVLDLHSGALSKGEKFINIYGMQTKIFTEDDFKLYKEMKSKIHETITKEFDIQKSKLYLTNPTFFSRMDSRPAKTKHDEYWHPHIDKITYKTFYYTSLLYLSEYGEDFNGGRFNFIGKRSNKTVEPKRGRLSFFTSGSENPHFVEPVSNGTRFAITVSFTCDPKASIKDPGE
ncbi:2-oxoglutarate and iron-dependent oxygenase domain-containing protein 3-like [Rhopilema esculentum]|uniref:2-oxoglutarate and iron-dependent oxygenase domain-containing protein 3-like n=1 Tax=Rhopilema esculentum TaxID=499914 RepID=UPI0031D49CEA|eukprot:gene12690-3403_t